MILDLVVDYNLSAGNNNLETVDISYANPISNELNVTINRSLTKELSFDIYSLQGKLLYSTGLQKINANQSITIPIENLDPGMYFLNVMDGNKKLASKKVIKL